MPLLRQDFDPLIILRQLEIDREDLKIIIADFMKTWENRHE